MGNLSYKVYNIDDDDVSPGSDPRDDRHRLLLRLPVRLLLRNVRRRLKSAKSELILRDPEKQHRKHCILTREDQNSTFNFEKLSRIELSILINV